jgi:O-antigen/teichoic acid export membrane protein
VAIAAVALAIVTWTAAPPDRAYAVIAVLSIIPYMLMAISAGAIEATQDFAANVWPSIVANLVNLVWTVAALALRWDLVGLTSALLASRTVDCVLRYHVYRKCFPRGTGLPDSIPAELRARLIRFAWQATALMSLNLVVWDRSEVFFLRLFSDIRQLAYYSLSFNIMSQILLLPQIFASAAGTNLLVEQGRDPAGLGNLTTNVLRYLALLAFPLTLGMAALSGPAIHLLYGPTYEPAIPVLLLVALSAIPRALLSPARQILVATENQAFLLRWGLLMAAFNLALDAWWIPSGAALGAALANGVAQCVAVGGIWAFVMRRFTIRPPGVVLLKMAVSAGVMGVVAALVARALPPLPGVLAGVIAGVVVYGALLRWTRSLDDADRGLLLGLRPQVPSWLRGSYSALVNAVIP